jgi:molybdopterin converting factor small subunit
VKVRVQFFSRLKDLVREPEAEYEVAEGSTVSDLLAQLYACSPALREWDSSLLVGVGVEFVQREYVLRPNDQIAIMPPVQGG